MSSKDKVVIFFKAGYDDKCFGACYQSQRVLMLSELKASNQVMPEFTCVPVNVSRPPDSFQNLGLRLRVPALHIQNDEEEKSEPIDVADDIVSTLQTRFPGGVISNHWEAQAETVTSNFFSKFCYLLRGVAKDSQHLEQELALIDEHLANVALETEDGGGGGGSLFLCGNQMSLVDCEVLPKLHQVRVAAASLKGYEMPSKFGHIWRYLYSAYASPVFVKFCPPDAEIVVHWLETTNQKQALLQQARQLLCKPPGYSFTVPAVARKIIL
ncbi:hypothetical protein LSTR_LSTR006274 [Laodelphax striatellus]|uniref:GST C-terminal domain-containing protein n=1 Tax=Laodelphax striatellus TaxID=195883 RepID=A0A482WRB4_LAOST|nr:hypothetical protein LSTR_LSTR006274 [Laodelphax striatellus]